MPQEMVSMLSKDQLENCILHMSWSAPLNFNMTDLSHYIIQIDQENITVSTSSTTISRSRQLYAYPVCICKNYTVSVQAVSIYGCVGISSGSDIVLHNSETMSFPVPLMCDDTQTSDSEYITQTQNVVSDEHAISERKLHCIYSY